MGFKIGLGLGKNNEGIKDPLLVMQKRSFKKHSQKKK